MSGRCVLVLQRAAAPDRNTYLRAGDGQCALLYLEHKQAKQVLSVGTP